MRRDPRTTRRRSCDWQTRPRSPKAKSPMSLKMRRDPRATRRKSRRRSHRRSHWTRLRTRASLGHRPRVHVLARSLVGPHRPASVQGGRLPDSHNDLASKVLRTVLQPRTCSQE